MKKLEIGDSVRIKNSGFLYSSYDTKFIEMGFKDPDAYKEFESKSSSERFKVFATGVHSTTKIPLFGIENDKGDQYLLSRKGLKMLLKPQKSELFMLALKRAINWRDEATEDELSKITMLAAEKAVIQRIYDEIAPKLFKS